MIVPMGVAGVDRKKKCSCANSGNAYERTGKTKTNHFNRSISFLNSFSSLIVLVVVHDVWARALLACVCVGVLVMMGVRTLSVARYVISYLDRDDASSFCLHPNITFFGSNFRLTRQDLFPVHFNPTRFARTLFTGIIDFDAGRGRDIPNPLIRDDTLDDFPINFTVDRHRSLARYAGILDRG